MYYERFTKMLQAELGKVRSLSRQRQDSEVTDRILVTAETMLRSRLRDDASYLGAALEDLERSLEQTAQLLDQGDTAKAKLQTRNSRQAVLDLLGFLV